MLRRKNRIKRISTLTGQWKKRISSICRKWCQRLACNTHGISGIGYWPNHLLKINENDSLLLQTTTTIESYLDKHLLNNVVISLLLLFAYYHHWSTSRTLFYRRKAKFSLIFHCRHIQIMSCHITRNFNIKSLREMLLIVKEPLLFINKRSELPKPAELA